MSYQPITSSDSGDAHALAPTSDLSRLRLHKTGDLSHEYLDLPNDCVARAHCGCCPQPEAEAAERRADLLGQTNADLAGCAGPRAARTGRRRLETTPMIPGTRRRVGEAPASVRLRLTAMAEALERRHDVLATAWESVREEVVDELDRAQRVSEAQFGAALDSAIEETRAGIAHALAVLDAGGYGICEDCGAAINQARLAFRPEATRCLACQLVADRRGAAAHVLNDRPQIMARLQRPSRRHERHGRAAAG